MSFDNTNWAGYDEIVLPNPNNDLTNFTLILSLKNLSTNWWSTVRSDGGDIRVTKSDGTQLATDLINFGTNSGILAINYTGILSSTGTQKLNIWVGNSTGTLLSASDPYGQYNAYDANLRAFYPTAANQDRTRYLNHLITTGILTPTTGYLHGSNATSFPYPGSAAYGTVITGNIPTSAPLSFLATANTSLSSNSNALIAVGNTGSVSNYMFIGLRSDISGSPAAITTQSQVGGFSNIVTSGTGIGTFSTNNWYRVAGVSTNATNRVIYLDATGSGIGVTSIFPVGLNAIGVGGYPQQGGVGAIFGGQMAFAQLHTTNLSKDWIVYDKLMHKPANKTQSGFYTFNGWNTLRPSNSITPIINGTKLVGSILNSTSGTWNTGIISQYRWQFAIDNIGTNTTNIISGIDNTLLLDESEGIKYIRVGVMATNSFGSTEAFSSWYGPIKVKRYINPLGNNNNSGILSSPWSTLEYAVDYCNNNTGIIDTLFIDTSSGPLYLTTGNARFTSGGSLGLTITNPNTGYSDVRFWELFNGNTGIKYDDKYMTGVSTYPNIWVFNSRPNCAIWEYMGGRGDNLKWFDHLKLYTNPSGTYNYTGNLSLLNSIPWTFWTGPDNSGNYVTLFNANGTLTGRQFALPFRPGQIPWGSPIEFWNGIISNICFGGAGGISESGATAPQSLIQIYNGAIMSGCIAYAGGTHNALAGQGIQSKFLNCIFGQIGGAEGPGAVTTTVWFSDSPTVYPYFSGCTCPALFGLGGSILGKNFSNTNSTTGVGLINAIGNFYVSHGNGTSAQLIPVIDCNIGGLWATSVSGYNSTLGAVSSNSQLQSCTITNAPLVNSFSGASGSFKDCLIRLNASGTDSSHFLYNQGSYTFTNCTFIAENFYNNVGYMTIFDALQGPLNLSITGCIFNLVGNTNQLNRLTNNMNLTGGDSYSADYNIFITTGPINAGLTISGTIADRNLPALQSLGFDRHSLSGTTNTVKLNSNYKVSNGSIAISGAPLRTNALDRTTIIFPSRTTIGAFEFIPSLIYPFIIMGY